jgi:hypothetical protein
MGQWFKGRIYERRCDLAPSGEKLIYFAAKYRSPLYTWTAVSRPPFLTALLLWPKGDAWGEPSGIYAGRGEDDPILSQRLLRDGWKLRQAPEGWENKPKSRIWHEFTKKAIWAKSSGSWTLEMLVAGIHERDGSWYVLEHQILDAQGRVALDLGRSDWADWSRSGELFFAREGRLFRIVVDGKSELGAPEELIDLRDLKFEASVAPPQATVWKGRSPRGRVLIR